MNTKSWKEIKNVVYEMNGTLRRDELERDTAVFPVCTVCV